MTLKNLKKYCFNPAYPIMLTNFVTFNSTIFKQIDIINECMEQQNFWQNTKARMPRDKK